MALVFFFLFGAIGAMTPFLSLYYRSVGLTGTEISLLLSIQPVLLFISQPIFGPLADRSGHRGRMLAALLAVVAVTGGIMGLGNTFWTLAPLMLLWSFFSGPLVPVADSLALGEAARTGSSYPRLRLWGSVGFVVITTICGRLYSHVDLRFAFVGYALLNLVAVAFARRLPPEGVPSHRPVWPELQRLLASRKLLAFLFLTGLLQVTQAAHSTFFSIHMQSLGGDNGLIGMAWGLAATMEVPVWLILGRVTRRVGPLPLLALSGLAYSLRWFLFSTAPSAGTVLWYQLLQALTFAIFMPTAVVYISKLVPDHLRTSGQALLVLVTGGIATVLGNMGAGYLYDLAGTALVYRAAAYVALAAGLGYLLLFRRTRSAEVSAA